jgi:hypothetical protein
MKRSTLALLPLAAMLLGGVVGTAYAGVAPVGLPERPGSGLGDINHCHEDGPPGLNSEGENERPGWGGLNPQGTLSSQGRAIGDQTYDHEDGPPGQNTELEECLEEN